MRKPLIAGNWKMYKTPKEAVAFLETFLPLVAGHSRDDIALFPSFTSLAHVLEAVASSNVRAGAQNMHWLNEGPYTGQTSPTMLASIGCHHVLLGHSDLRRYFDETNERVNLKLQAAISHGFTPVVCVGESLAEREAGQTEATLRTQVSIALRDITPSETHRLTIAYEPVWAIGAGQAATPETAAEAHAIIRHELAHCLGQQRADATRILYGGSVKLENIVALMQQDGIDGALVGGASLDPATFAKLVQY
jgi:triosephosphate isomerase